MRSREMRGEMGGGATPAREIESAFITDEGPRGLEEIIFVYGRSQFGLWW